jgi:hypothetical protein
MSGNDYMAELLDFEDAMLPWREFESGHWGVSRAVRNICAS